MSTSKLNTKTAKPNVPPSSPNEEFDFDLECLGITEISDRLDNFEVPIVRDLGVKETLDRLAQYFGLVYYKLSLPQFWFLDIVAECIWKTQDEYFFPDNYQKLILRWVLYFVNLVRAKDNFDRKVLFRIFSEAISIAEDNIKNGDALSPPEELFEIAMGHGEEESHSLSTHPSVTNSGSSISLDSKTSDKNYLAVDFDKNMDVFKIDDKVCIKSVECLTTDIGTLTESDMHGFTEEDMEYELEEAKSAPPVEYESLDYILRDTTDSEDLKSKFENRNILHQLPNELNINRFQNDHKEEAIIKAWTQYQLWQLHTEQMCDARRGWVNTKEMEEESSKEESYNADFKFWLSYIKIFDERLLQINDNIFVNMCATMTIKQLVFDHFYESFQFMMLKILFHCPHYHVTQKINIKWNVPKRLKSEIKRPAKRKPPKPVKEKVKKEKKSDKKSKKDKKSKSSKKSSKSSKSKKSSKKSEKKKLTKEEKEELARLELERQLQEEAMRKEAENKVFMFPLTDATDEQFYQGIFENWVPPVKEEEKKRKKKKK